MHIDQKRVMMISNILSVIVMIIFNYNVPNGRQPGEREEEFLNNWKALIWLDVDKGESL